MIDPLAVIEATADAIGFDDAEGNVVYANAAYRNLFGIGPGEPLGRLEDQVTEATLARLRRWTTLRMQGGPAPTNYEMQILRRDGTTRWVDVSVVPVESEGRVVGTCAILRDSTERQEREQALRRAQAQYRELFERAFDAIIVFEPEQEIVLDVNQRACELYGRTREEFIGMSLLSISPLPRSGRSVLSGLAKGEAIDNIQTVQWHKDGSELLLECNASMIEYQGRPAVMSINRDISARRRMEQRVAHSAKMAGIGRLAAGVAHEFNNVLASIIGTAEVVRAQADDSEARELITQMIARAQTGANITRQLLALSRKPEPSAGRASVDSCVESMLGWLSPLLGEDVELRLSPSSPGVEVMLEEARVEQLLLNLTINARDAMADGGVLEVSTIPVDLAEPRQTTTHRLAPGPYVAIEVRDTGPGIAPDALPRLFEPFYTTKGLGSGTGLGLATVYSIVDGAGGGIDVRSLGGACFTILLPRASEAEPVSQLEPMSQPESPPAPTPPPKSDGAGTVLLVDDEVIIVNALARNLRKAGYEVQTAHDPQTALEVLGEGMPIDVLVTDLSMPGGDGIDLAREAQRRRPGLRVLIMSGHADHDLPRDLRNALFLPKPFSRDVLLGRIAQLLGA